jgi:adenylate cyclase class IV
MKTISEIKFDKIIKDGFQELLKPLGFKKKANNFYLKLETIGQIINVQKSSFGNKDSISFTINTGIFVPEYWLAFYNFSDKGLPDYPTEPECLIRKRIGSLRNQQDTWYDIEERTDEQQLISEMRKNLTDFILPYFNRLNSAERMLEEFDSPDMTISPLGKLIVYGEFRQFEKAKREYELLISKKTNSHFLMTIKDYGLKYELDK